MIDQDSRDPDLRLLEKEVFHCEAPQTQSFKVKGKEKKIYGSL